MHSSELCAPEAKLSWIGFHFGRDIGYLILHFIFSIGTHYRLPRMQMQKCVLNEGPVSFPSLNVHVPCTVQLLSQWLLINWYFKKFFY